MFFPICFTALKHSVCCLESEVTFMISANICCLPIHKIGNKTSNVHCTVNLSSQEDLASSSSSQQVWTRFLVIVYPIGRL